MQTNKLSNNGIITLEKYLYASQISWFSLNVRQTVYTRYFITM
ncbi:hypothetical protein LGAA44_220004 [Leuconostoc gasicomitatum]|nr:hypothetical protein LGAA44_220004 [Leuconostoc gasicomitatum]